MWVVGEPSQDEAVLESQHAEEEVAIATIVHVALCSSQLCGMRCMIGLETDRKEKRKVDGVCRACVLRVW